MNYHLKIIRIDTKIYILRRGLRVDQHFQGGKNLYVLIEDVS